jgi:hypothetical protein
MTPGSNDRLQLHLLQSNTHDVYKSLDRTATAHVTLCLAAHGRFEFIFRRAFYLMCEESLE